MAKAASKTQAAKLQVVESKVEEMPVQVLPSPDRLKELREQQRAVRLEMKNIKDALDKQKEAEKEAKMAKLSPKERAAYSIRKKLLKVAGSVKKQDFVAAYGELMKLAKEVEKAQDIE